MVRDTVPDPDVRGAFTVELTGRLFELCGMLADPTEAGCADIDGGVGCIEQAEAASAMPRQPIS